MQRKSTCSKRQWHLPQPALETEINHPFFNALPQLDIDDVIYFVQQRCQFLDEFQHILHRNRRTTFEDTALVAALVAWTTNTGIGHMSGISDMSQSQLTIISHNFLRPHPLKPANDRVINYIASLPIFQHHMINNEHCFLSQSMTHDPSFCRFYIAAVSQEVVFLCQIAI